jgi:cellulose 1,4-beta-cellobiosidase
MLWLDSLDPPNATGPGVSRGSCAITSGNPPDVIANSPDATVKYSAISLGPIGWSAARLAQQQKK